MSSEQALFLITDLYTDEPSLHGRRLLVGGKRPLVVSCVPVQQPIQT